MNRLDNKIAVITGGASGQGAAEAELFIAAGAQVVITDIDAKAGAATANRLGEACLFIDHDVASEQSWTTVIDTVTNLHGQVDVLVNNAGILRMGNLQETSLDVWNQVIAINQTGVFLGMRAVAPIMTKNKTGSIVNISSIAGLVSAARAHAYSATKWAVRGMTKSAAVELAPMGVRVNSVHPGYIETSMLDEIKVPRQVLTDTVPLGRIAKADEVGRMVLFLASEDSSYCTGHEFVVDGALKS